LILTDTGVLVALIATDERDHVRCAAALNTISGPMITTWAVFTEAMHLLRRGRGGWHLQSALWRLQERESLLIHPFDDQLTMRSRELMTQYQDTPMDLADATLVALAERLRLRELFTLDGHFHTYRLAGGQALDLIPQ
jgi:predicted nucleic acid-binding protein